MTDAIDNIKKSKRGRPKADTEPVMVRMERTVLARLDEWRASQRPIPTRPDAIRHFLEIGIGMIDDQQE